MAKCVLEEEKHLCRNGGTSDSYFMRIGENGSGWIYEEGWETLHYEINFPIANLPGLQGGRGGNHSLKATYTSLIAKKFIFILCICALPYWF